MFSFTILFVSVKIRNIHIDGLHLILRVIMIIIISKWNNYVSNELGINNTIIIRILKCIINIFLIHIFLRTGHHIFFSFKISDKYIFLRTTLRILSTKIIEMPPGDKLVNVSTMSANG